MGRAKVEMNQFEVRAMEKQHYKLCAKNALDYLHEAALDGISVQDINQRGRINQKYSLLRDFIEKQHSEDCA